MTNRAERLGTSPRATRTHGAAVSAYETALKHITARGTTSPERPMGRRGRGHKVRIGHGRRRKTGSSSQTAPMRASERLLRQHGNWTRRYGLIDGICPSASKLIHKPKRGPTAQFCNRSCRAAYASRRRTRSISKRTSHGTGGPVEQNRQGTPAIGRADETRIT